MDKNTIENIKEFYAARLDKERQDHAGLEDTAIVFAMRDVANQFDLDVNTFPGYADALNNAFPDPTAQEQEQEAAEEAQEPAENILYLEKRGCNFFSGDPVVNLSDVGNYRVVTHGECIPAPNGRMYCFEFCHYDRYRYRTENKRTGKPLKHPVKVLANPNACSIHSQFSDTEGCWGDLELEEKFYSGNHSYTVSELLSIVNGISSRHYDRIIFADQEAIEAIPSVRKIAGWRENAIIDSLQEVKFIEATKDYTVYRFIGIIDGEERSFEYEAKSGRITG